GWSFSSSVRNSSGRVNRTVAILLASCVSVATSGCFRTRLARASGLVQNDPFPLIIEHHVGGLARGDPEHAEPAADVIPSERCNALRSRIGVRNALCGAPLFGFFP